MHHISQKCPDAAAYDMCQLRDVVAVGDAAVNLPSDIECRDKHQCDRYRPLFHAGKRGQQYERKHHAARAEQLDMREKDAVHNPCHQCRRQDHKQYIGRTILFLKQRPHDQQHHDIANEVFPVRMPEHMPEQTHICQRGQQRRAVHAKQRRRRPPFRDIPQYQ